jgi:hypothetical protein
VAVGQAFLIAFLGVWLSAEKRASMKSGQIGKRLPRGTSQTKSWQCRPDFLAHRTRDFRSARCNLMIVYDKKINHGFTLEKKGIVYIIAAEELHCICMYENKHCGWVVFTPPL